MAKPRDSVYAATKVVNMAELFSYPPENIPVILMGLVNDLMDEVRQDIDGAGHGPSQQDPPTLTLTFTAKGGAHHAKQDSEGG